MSFFRLLLQRERPSAFPPSRAAFVSPHLFSLDDNGLAVIVFRLPSCSSLSYSRRVLSMYCLVSWMTKRQRWDRIGADR
jgi:hypothetical protein